MNASRSDWAAASGRTAITIARPAAAARAVRSDRGRGMTESSRADAGSNISDDNGKREVRMTVLPAWARRVLFVAMTMTIVGVYCVLAARLLPPLRNEPPSFLLLPVTIIAGMAAAAI